MLFLIQCQSLSHMTVVAESVKLPQLFQARLAYFLYDLHSLKASVSHSCVLGGV